MKLLTVPLEKPLSPEARKSLREGSFYLSSGVADVAIDDKSITIQYVEGSEVGSIETALNELIETTIKNFKRVKEQKLFELKGKGTFGENPMQKLLDDGVLFHHGPGRYSYSGWLVEFINALDNTFRDYALKQGAMEEMYPPTVMTLNMTRAGYVKSFPHHALFVSPINRSPQTLEAVANDKSDGIPVHPEQLVQPETMLAPTVCYRCFEAHQNLTLKGEGNLFTAIGHCNRNEGFIDDDLTRMQSFLMREIIYVGDENFVKKSRQDNVMQAQDFAEEHGLNVRVVTASDPFFANTSGEKSTYQSVSQTKLEMQIYLPYADKWMSCMSFNNHQQTLVGAFDIKAGDKATHSGCTGYGYDRLVFGILAQYGTKPENLPESLRKLLSK